MGRVIAIRVTVIVSEAFGSEYRARGTVGPRDERAMAGSSRLQRRAARGCIALWLAAGAFTLAACQSPPSSSSSREPAAEIAAVAPPPVPAVDPPPVPGDAETLYFEPGSSALSDSQMVILATLARRMESHSALRVHVVSYSDSSAEETLFPRRSCKCHWTISE